MNYRDDDYEDTRFNIPPMGGMSDRNDDFDDGKDFRINEPLGGRMNDDFDVGSDTSINEPFIREEKEDNDSFRYALGLNGVRLPRNPKYDKPGMGPDPNVSGWIRYLWERHHI